VLFFSLIERSVLMALVFYHKDMLEKVTMQRTQQFSAFSLGAFHSTQNCGVNLGKFPWANGTDFSGVENAKSHSFVRLEFFNDFEV